MKKLLALVLIMMLITPVFASIAGAEAEKGTELRICMASTDRKSVV